MQNGDGRVGKTLHAIHAGKKKAPENQGLTAFYVGIQGKRMGDEGFDSSQDAMGENAMRDLSAAYSGAFCDKSGLKRLAELWPMIEEDDRAALLEHAEHLAALRVRMLSSGLA